MHLAAISKARRPKPKRAGGGAAAATEAPAGAGAVTECIWVQCDECDKWRRVEQAPDEGAPWQCALLEVRSG